MARKPKPKPKRAKKAARTRKPASRRGAAKADAPERIIRAALALGAAEGWRRITLSDIAKAAGVPLAEVRSHFPAKVCILTGLQRRVDRAVLAAGPVDRAEPVRDRLFDLLMRRFDALGPYKEHLGRVLRDSLADPVDVIVGGTGLLPSMAMTLDAAGIPSSGLLGLAKADGLGLVYLCALRVWFGDDTPDLGRTMAALDKGLGRAERAAALCCRLRPPRRAATGG